MKENEDEQSQMKAIEVLNSEMKVKYPVGSTIMFSTSYNKGEKPVTTSCGWYDKVGGTARPLKNIVDKPAEWQNIPYEEAEKIGEMFDKCMHVNIAYV
jgi:hypothetical protein